MNLPKFFILDVDGVMNDGKIYYTDSGKFMKVFSANDSDGLKLIQSKLKIQFISADKRGYEITKKRIQTDMGYELELVSENERYDYLFRKFKNENFIYMGDGHYDSFILQDCFYGIAPKNATKNCKNVANYITESIGGEGAVYEACIHILEKIFKIKF